jgi:hypothetical protein
MKKLKSKLTLRTETIRSLDGGELARVAGGYSVALTIVTNPKTAQCAPEPPSWGIVCRPPSEEY